MPKYRRRSPPPAMKRSKKRLCLRGISNGSQWPSDDDSLFDDSKLQALLTRPRDNSRELLDPIDIVFDGATNPDDGVDDTMLGAEYSQQMLDMNIASIATDSFAEEGREHGQLNDDTLFGDINVDDGGEQAHNNADVDELFTDNAGDDVGPQSTQMFLDDLRFKVPDLPENTKRRKITAGDTLFPKIQGTQYMTRQQLNSPKACAAILTAQHDLSSVNWDSQVFGDSENGNAIPRRGDFYGLPARVKHLIFENKGITSLYEWQDECLNLPAVSQRKNLIYALPTSGGKTLVAEILMLREVICRERNVLFVLPYVSLVQEKVSAMAPFAIALDFNVDEYTAGKGKCPPHPLKKRNSIYIASIEKGAVLMDSLIEAKRANEIGLVVVDELHLIGERGRGATLEAFLTKVMFIKAGIQIVGMSATIGNITEISKFLNADVYTRGFRPVELTEYVKCGNDLLQINPSGQSLEEMFVLSRRVDFQYSDSVRRMDPDHLGGLVAECAPAHGCLIFCPSRKNCENVATLLCHILPKSKFVKHRASEKIDLMDSLRSICGVLSPVLARTIPYGIAYHHSGLTSDERRFIEIAYRMGVLSVICCTSTLAAGVNLPAQRVIIRAPYVGAEFITLSKYKQMVGRAGRAGLGVAGDSILISTKRDNVHVGQLLLSPMDKALSSLDQNDGVAIKTLVLSAVGMGIASNCIQLVQMLNNTLLAVQANELGITIIQLISKTVRDMVRHKVLTIADKQAHNVSSSSPSSSPSLTDASQQPNEMMIEVVTQKRRIHIRRTTPLKLSTIGMAAFKAGIDYQRAEMICNELRAAQPQLILNSYCHLLYLVVCFNSNARGDELFAADATILFAQYAQVDEPTQRLFKQVGFSESRAAQLGITLSVQGPFELQLNRLYKMLILKDLLDLVDVPVVAVKYKIERGTVQHLVSQSTAAASAIVRLCDVLEEFWCYRALFERVNRKIDRCGSVEVEPLLDLPGVKIQRAKQLYAAGFTTIAAIAQSKPLQLVHKLEHMSLRVAKEIVAAAQIILRKKIDTLEEETEALKLALI